MWWLKRIIGTENSTYLSDLSDDSSSDSEFDYSLEPRHDKKTTGSLSNNSTQAQNSVPIEADDNVVTDFTSREMLTIDASVKSFPKPEMILTLDGVLGIEKNLDDYEIVSLLYLLHDEPNYVLQELMLFLDGANKKLLYTWAKWEEGQCRPWQKKLIEALCVIKNYQILSTLGYGKNDVILHYLPHLETAVTNLNKAKKAIYLVCEKLNVLKTDNFLKITRRHFQEKNMAFKEFNQEFLELYFLHWETVGYISMSDLSNIKRTLKVMEEETLYAIIESVFATPRESVESVPKVRGTSTDTHRGVVPKSFSRDFLSSPSSLGQDDVMEPIADNHKYEIDPKNPGVLLIINQEDFYTEFETKFLHLLPADIEENKLEFRKGTEKDKEELIRTFSRFGFQIVNVDNLTHEELIEKVKEVVRSIRNESSLFVCILSHGDKGIVYGVNSCKVKVSKIQEIMCKTNKNLMGKPKILILQSCQGRQCQKIKEWSDEEEDFESFSVTTDGPGSSKQSIPQTVDMLTFWATGPGFAAIRNKNTGSWFIQALVKKMSELGNKHHFADICTRILNDVSGKVWTVRNDEKNAMTPMVVSTLRKDFYLPPMRDN